jgi:lipopolysaccharide transport system ATP-binding protein
MSNDIVIRVENLGKKYLIRHEQRERYVALRDVLTNKFKSIGRKVLQPMSHELRAKNSSEEDFWALKDVSFEIKQGERVGIIGRNGAGKTTLLKLLSRITEPTAGRITLKGRVASLLEVGTGFHPELTGRENIFLNGAILGMSKVEIKKKFDEIVDFAEIEKFLDTPVKRYSSGMYVRLAFAVAAHLEPEILIVDEVLAVGDAQFQKKCIGKMEEVGKEGRTVLFVSHNMPAVQRLCGTAIILKNGRMIAFDEVSSVVKIYLDNGGNEVYSWVRDAEAGSDAYISKIMLVDQHYGNVTFVETGSDVRVAFEFIINNATKNLQVSVGLLDEYGNVIFGSSPQDSGIGVPESPGKHRAIVTYPKDLLQPRLYGIRVVLWTPDNGILDCMDKIHFIPQETASLANSTPGGRAGIIAIRCKWNLD